MSHTHTHSVPYNTDVTEKKALSIVGFRCPVCCVRAGGPRDAGVSWRVWLDVPITGAGELRGGPRQGFHWLRPCPRYHQGCRQPAELGEHYSYNHTQCHIQHWIHNASLHYATLMACICVAAWMLWYLQRQWLGGDALWSEERPPLPSLLLQLQTRLHLCPLQQGKAHIGSRLCPMQQSDAHRVPCLGTNEIMSPSL